MSSAALALYEKGLLPLILFKDDRQTLQQQLRVQSDLMTAMGDDGACDAARGHHRSFLAQLFKISPQFPVSLRGPQGPRQSVLYSSLESCIQRSDRLKKGTLG